MIQSLLGEWASRGLCRSADDLDLWFEVSVATTHQTANATAVAEAKTHCGFCPVRDECLSWALDHEEPFGIWGGKTTEERKAILQARKDAA